jgi:hypothetical protein
MRLGATMENPFRAAKHMGVGLDERFVPGYKAVSTVDLLMNAPFDE